MADFRVLCFDGGRHDGAAPRTVEAGDEQEAAETVCGEPLVEGLTELTELRAAGWAVSPPATKKMFRAQPQKIPD